VSAIRNSTNYLLDRIHQETVIILFIYTFKFKEKLKNTRIEVTKTVTYNVKIIFTPHEN